MAKSSLQHCLLALPLLLLLFSGRGSDSQPTSTTPTAEEGAFLTALYKECWTNCYSRFCNAVTVPYDLFDAVDSSFEADNYTSYCSAYRTSRSCASGCVPLEHSSYLSAFYAKNNLNELICMEQPEEFVLVHDCLNGDLIHPLSFYYDKCNFPMVGESRDERISVNGEHCRSFKCVRRYMPHFVRESCGGSKGDRAVTLLQKMADAWLRDRIDFTLLAKGCVKLNLG